MSTLESSFESLNLSAMFVCMAKNFWLGHPLLYLALKERELRNRRVPSYSTYCFMQRMLV